MVRHLVLHLLITEMIPGQISVPEVFGVDARVHFLILRCFIPMHLHSYCQTHVGSLFCRHELEKKCEYGDRVCSIKSVSFTPLVFFTFGGLGREASIFYSHLANLLAA